MQSDLGAALAAPLLDLQAAVGSGVFAGDDPVQMLRDVSSVLTDVAVAGATAAGQMSAAWSGAAADAATWAISTALSGAGELATQGFDMATRVGAASDAIARAKAKLRHIVDDFETTTRALEPDLPDSAPAIVEAARRALEDAMGVVAELEAELDGHTAAINAPGAASATMTTPAGLMSSMLPLATSPPSTLAGLTSGILGSVPGLDQIPDEAMLTVDTLDGGVGVQLPGGGTATAPNQVAADAVRYALTQIGVPYDWGGETPGVGMDCSGLTQWAYHEAGLNLPRMAADQDVGAVVSPSALMPGDLAVWDGHVAMIVGNGMMIEAGDPVGLSPIRTTNLGQGFHGFFRPTS